MAPDKNEKSLADIVIFHVISPLSVIHCALVQPLALLHQQYRN
jgi:hypothetical protein